MKVEELIESLNGMDPDAEIGYEVHSDGIDLLIGENPNTGESVRVPKPDWNP